MTLETKLTMAEAGWLGSSSAKRWQALSVVLPCFRATKPKSLQGQERGERVRGGQEGAQALENCPGEQAYLEATLSPSLHISLSMGIGGGLEERILCLFHSSARDDRVTCFRVEKIPLWGGRGGFRRGEEKL